VGNSKQRGGLQMGRRVFENMQKWLCEEVETVDLSKGFAIQDRKALRRKG
jgi:hypothetical protein